MILTIVKLTRSAPIELAAGIMLLVLAVMLCWLYP